MKYSFKKIIKSNEAKYFLSFAIGGVIQFIFGYALTFVSNYTLDKEGIGKFNYYFNLSNLLVNFMSFGLYASYIRIIGEGFDAALRRLVLNFYILLSLLYCIICYSLNLYFMMPFTFMLFFNERQYYYRSQENTFLYLLGQVLKGITLLFMVGICYYYHIINYENLIIIVGLSYFFSSIIFFVIQGKKKSNEKEKRYKFFSFDFLEDVDLKKVFSISVPTQFTAMATWFLLFSDQYIIKMYYSFEELGPYSVAMRLIVFLNIISGLFLLYYPKFFFKSFNSLNFSKVKIVRKSFFLALTLAMVILIFFRNYLYQILGAAKFSEYSSFFIFLALAETFRILASINFTFLSFIYKTKYATYSIVFISGLNIVLNLLFIQKIGIIFAAYSTLFCCFILYIISYLISIRLENQYIKSKQSA